MVPMMLYVPQGQLLPGAGPVSTNAATHPTMLQNMAPVIVYAPPPQTPVNAAVNNVNPSSQLVSIPMSMPMPMPMPIVTSIQYQATVGPST
jgi:hypothetical protein